MKQLILIFSVILLSTSAFAGNGHAKFKLMFADETGINALENAHVTVYEDGIKVLDQTFKGHHAKFKVKANHRYIIIVKKDGFEEYACCYDLTNATEKDRFSFDSIVRFTTNNDCAPQAYYNPSKGFHFDYTLTDVPTLKSEIKGS
jgi:hypothetical protein